MNPGEQIALVVVLLLALYGCAQLIRQICLWITRCPRSVRCYRLYVPGKNRQALEPLLHCLQTQAVWSTLPAGGKNLLLLPPLNEGQQQVVDLLCRENPAVQPVTRQQLEQLLLELQEEEINN